jgi:two-component system chemotaxis response regulator CheB
MAVAGRIRIMIVDDSAVMRSLLRSVITADPGLEVAGTAADGAAALGCLESIRPQLILLDVEMPVMNGLATLRALRERGHKMPVIMCSSLTQQGAKVTLEALSAGASDYVAKPTGQSNREEAVRALSQELFPKIHALVGALPHAHPALPVVPRAPLLFPNAPLGPLRKASPITAQPTVLAIGVSTGGPAALDLLLPALPESFPLPVLIVQHMPEVFTRLFAERLSSLCRLRVREASEGDAIVPGVISIARGNWHLEAVAASRPGAPSTLHLSQGPLENHCRPAVDVLFRSAARVYGSGVLAVVLTGMGSDGMNGCRVIREQGGSVLAQDEASSIVWGMPGAVATAGLAHKVLPLAAIAPEILRIAGQARASLVTLREPNRAVS